MKKLEHDDMMQLCDDMVELKQLNSLLGFMQTAFAEGASVINEGEAAEALYHIYTKQREILKQMQETLSGTAVA